ncbi:MAG TPA: protein-glutamate O-methyltransferase CheR [Gammaproteobacteria bacterium]|nr:protein-glutamate O-methyltransferase CheR [Gammaproteobacteria bacterium]
MTPGSTASAAAEGGAGIPRADLERFRDFFYRATGIFFDDGKELVVTRCLKDRMQATGHADFLSYFQFLRFRDDGAEFDRLVSGLTVNETYFYREDYQFRCLVESVLPEVMDRKRPGEPVRIWSIPCSTGEEPYSIAIQLLEAWPRVDTVEVEIHASDIDVAAVERAREGLYGAYAVRNLEARVLARYFNRTHAGKYRIHQALRGSIDFRAGNLVDPSLPNGLPSFDVIFCRNMLIYFDDRSRRLAAQNLYDVLAPGGFVFLGHAESMSRITSLFEARRFPAAFAYQKPEGAQ